MLDETSAIHQAQTLKFMTEKLIRFSLSFPLTNVKRITFSECLRVPYSGLQLDRI